MNNLPYPENDGQTHFPGCYRHARHHNCAVAEVDRLRAVLERIANADTRTVSIYDDALWDAINDSIARAKGGSDAR